MAEGRNSSAWRTLTRLVLAASAVACLSALPVVSAAPALASSGQHTTGIEHGAPGASPLTTPCNDPEDPCYTADEMNSYWVAQSHGFYHLDPSYNFPANIVSMAQAQHQIWCQHHPGACPALDRQLHRMALAETTALHEPKLNARVAPCGPKQWWCNERGLISCAGGSLVPYWSCGSGTGQDAVNQMDNTFSTAQKMELVAAGTIEDY